MWTLTRYFRFPWTQLPYISEWPDVDHMWTWILWDFAPNSTGASALNNLRGLFTGRLQTLSNSMMFSSINLIINIVIVQLTFMYLRVTDLCEPKKMNNIVNLISWPNLKSFYFIFLFCFVMRIFFIVYTVFLTGEI